MRSFVVILNVEALFRAKLGVRSVEARKHTPTADGDLPDFGMEDNFVKKNELVRDSDFGN